MKIKKYVILSLLIIIIMFIPSCVQAKTYDISNTVVNNLFNNKGVKIGDKIKFTWQDRKARKDLYCIERGIGSPDRKANGAKAHTIASGIIITGNKATNIANTKKTTTNDYNAILSYILSREQGWVDSKDWSTAGQCALWQNIEEWYSANASGLGISINVNEGDTSKSERKRAKDTIEEANDYAARIKANGISTTPAVPTKVNTNISVVNQDGYTKVGPFKLSFTGTLSDLKVYNGSTSIEIAKIKNAQNQDITQNKIASNTDFYICLNNKSGNTGITKITGKINPKSTEPIYQTTIYFLNGGTWQNNLLARTKTLTPTARDFSIDYSADMTIRLKIKKIDKDTKQVLPNAGFKISCPDKSKYVAIQNGKTVLVDQEASATIFYTKSDGMTDVITLPIIGATYVIKETNAPGGYILNTQQQQVNITNSVKEVTLTFENEKIPDPRIDISIKKVDSKNTNIPLEGAQFIFKNTTKGQWIYQDAQGKYQLTSNQASALKAITNSQGIITLNQVPEGEYEVTEIQAPPGYTISSQTVKIAANPTIIPNKKRYISIEGNVFVDGHQGKVSLLNNMYDEGEGIDGVKVTLKLDGKVISNVSSGYSSTGAKCGKNGQYKFDGEQLEIERDNLKRYTIEFEYNGLKYESVAIQPQIVAGASSKAKEKQTEREAFNTRYSTVTADTKIANGKSTNKSKGGDTITYTSQSYTSKVLYQTSSKDDKGNAYGNEVYADEQYHVKSYTTEAGLDLSKQTYPYDPSKDTIVDINFGIYEREHPDVAISSDLAVAETSINGYTQIYPYQKRYGQIENDSAFTVEVKSSDLTYNSSYQRKLYKSDVQYTQVTNDESELAVYLTYKVVIKNQSSSINVTVDDIVDYFSKDVTGGIVAIGTNARQLSEIPAKTNSNRYQLTNANGMQYSSITDDSGYSKQYITLNKEIKTGEKYQFYVQYKMSIEAIRKTLGQDFKFNNVFELNTVSAKTKNEEVWTAVDMDSAVGNCVPSDKRTMEDDTDYAPGIDIITRDDLVRQITGIVFEDQTPEEFLTGQERKGNGQYDSGEKGVPNAIVQLIDIDRGGKIAYSNISGTDTKSEANGNYTIKGFIPGNYIIKYTYGNGTGKYTAQQYKSTIYVDQARANANYANKDWYKDETNRKSDAIDNYNGEIRTLYDMSQTTINMSRTEIEKIWNQADGMQHILNGTNVDNTIKIDAFTPHVGMPVEKEGAREGEYVVANIDFGVVERARYQVKIEKTIARIKLIKPDGSILREFSDFNNPPANTSVMKSTETERNGFVHFSIDAELLQATTLLVDYGFKATNTSEIEYIDETYYKYGIVPLDKENKKVKLSIVNVIDYVDNQLQYLEDNSTLTNGKTNKLNGWSIIDLNAEENKKYVSEDVRKSLYKDGKCEFSTILIGKGLDGEMLKSGENQSTVLTLNKILTTSQGKLSYENMVEAVEVKKTWGRELYMEDTTNSYGQKLGNLDPVNERETRKAKDPDTGYSEKIIIANPEGGNRNYTIYVISGIVSAIILAIGIVLIKKKAL